MTLDGGFWEIVNDGNPRHPTGAYPNSHNPLYIRSQTIRYQCTAKPVMAAIPIPIEIQLGKQTFAEAAKKYPSGVFSEADRRVGYEFGVALNGMPFNPNGPWYQSNGSIGWQFHALAPEALIEVGIDFNHGHPKQHGQYHYHGIPSGLIDALRNFGRTDDPLLLGLAADGFPIYHDARVDSSYVLIAGVRPEGAPPGSYDGTFTQDYVYAKSDQPGALDECNGRFGVTSEFPSGTYHYIIAESFPNIPRFFRGIPDISFVEDGGGSVCSPLPDNLWAYGGLNAEQVQATKRTNLCLNDPRRSRGVF